MKEEEINEILQLLKDKMPMIYDLESQDIKYDRKNEYYKIYNCIYKLKEEIKKLKGK